MDQVLNFFKKHIIPEFIFKRISPIYHFCLAALANFIYNFPSRKIFVIGVTGTKGKTTTASLIAQILNSAGYKTGVITTVFFGIGKEEWPNEFKQTMPGRFRLQKTLAQMVKEKCKYAVIETTSEGITQYRHRFIDYSAAVFTNLSPEHIERHGGFENYRDAKIKLFEKVAQKEHSIGIYNLDDENVSYFLKPKIKNRYFYTLNPKEKQRVNIQNLNVAFNIKSSIKGTKFSFYREKPELISKSYRLGQAHKNALRFEMPLIGEFNVYNAAAAICLALSQNIPIEKIKKALKSVKPVPGRMEIVNKKGGPTVIIDYAHTPESLEKVYKTMRDPNFKTPKSDLICVLGAAGSGRDKWKRPVMGKIATHYCDKIILTNEDPFDEDPLAILDDLEAGIIQNPKFKIKKNYWKVLDRQQAIKKAIYLAKKRDVLITGKGGEMWMCVKNNKKIPWNERKIVEEILAKIKDAKVKNQKYN